MKTENSPAVAQKFSSSPTATVSSGEPPWVSVVMPIRKCRATVGKSLDALYRQEVPSRCEIIFVCDREDDDSIEVIRAHPLVSKWVAVEIYRPGRGLAESYNLGWKAARSKYVLFMHSDCYPVDDDALRRVVECLECKNVLAVQPLVGIPKSDWDTMSFWDRVTSSQFRHAKPEHGLGGKFDLFRRDVLEKLGGYDEERFFSSAEDADMHERLCALGETACSDVLVIHAHKHPPSARFSSTLRKHAQLGEGSGALFRKYWRSPDFLRRAYVIIGLNVLKLAFLVGMFIPPVSLYSAVLMLLLATYYGRWAMLSRDWRVVLIPFAVSLMFAVFAVSMVKAFLLGQQSFDYVRRSK